jgi:hypothetical protein
VRSLARLRLRYPDGSHDAESLAVHPDGTIFILTKEYSGNPTAAQSSAAVQLFKLTPEQRKKAESETTALETVGAIDFARLLPDSPVNARIPTAMDITRDGKRILILLYMDAIELALDLSKPFPSLSTWREGKEFQRIKLVNLQQQEAVAYIPDGTGFFYETERGLGRGAAPARLMRVSCPAPVN